MTLFQSLSQLPDSFFFGAGFLVFAVIGYLYGYSSGWAQGYEDYDYTTRKTVAPKDETR